MLEDAACLGSIVQYQQATDHHWELGAWLQGSKSFVYSGPVHISLNKRCEGRHYQNLTFVGNLPQLLSRTHSNQHQRDKLTTSSHQLSSSSNCH